MLAEIGKPALLRAAQRVPLIDGRGIEVRRRRHLRDDLGLAVLPVLDRQRLAEEMDVGRRARAHPGDADRRLDLRAPRCR